MTLIIKYNFDSETEIPFHEKSGRYESDFIQTWKVSYKECVRHAVQALNLVESSEIEVCFQRSMRFETSDKSALTDNILATPIFWDQLKNDVTLVFTNFFIQLLER